MKTKLFLALSLALFLFVKNASAAETVSAGDYYVNDAQVENLFNNSKEVNFSDDNSTTSASTVVNTMSLNASAATKFGGRSYKSTGDKNFVAAFLLDFFLGGLGIHRLYLGTNTFTWVGYILTCGGIFGIVPLVDLIVLIVHNDDISDFVDNPKFFMWGGQ